MDEKATEAVRKRFIMEEAMRTKAGIEELCAMKILLNYSKTAYLR